MICFFINHVIWAGAWVFGTRVPNFSTRTLTQTHDNRSNHICTQHQSTQFSHEYRPIT